MALPQEMMATAATDHDQEYRSGDCWGAESGVSREQARSRRRTGGEGEGTSSNSVVLAKRRTHNGEQANDTRAFVAGLAAARAARKSSCWSPRHFMSEGFFVLLVTLLLPRPVAGEAAELHPSCYINWEVDEVEAEACDGATDACFCFAYVRILNEVAFYFVLFTLIKYTLLGTQ
ncbi:unnamed protein product [Amoebophrya sp. A120]|nr:unnamed protein product [Amoebophrya sp. A120]|eukprot:GSA120T00002516001.1